MVEIHQLPRHRGKGADVGAATGDSSGEILDQSYSGRWIEVHSQIRHEQFPSLKTHRENCPKQFLYTLRQCVIGVKDLVGHGVIQLSNFDFPQHNLT